MLVDQGPAVDVHLLSLDLPELPILLHTEAAVLPQWNKQLHCLRKTRAWLALVSFSAGGGNIANINSEKLYFLISSRWTRWLLLL